VNVEPGVGPWGKTRMGGKGKREGGFRGREDGECQCKGGDPSHMAGAGWVEEGKGGLSSSGLRPSRVGVGGSRGWEVLIISY
jgi:hypothetical protein